MPTEVLTQLRTLRESIADALRKDPRYLTLMALDKTIAEIDGVLRLSGVATDQAQLSEPLNFDAARAAPPYPTDPKSFRSAEPEVSQKTLPEAAPVTHPAQVGTSAVDAPAMGLEGAADEPKEDELGAHAASVETPLLHDPDVEGLAASATETFATEAPDEIQFSGHSDVTADPAFSTIDPDAPTPHEVALPPAVPEHHVPQESAVASNEPIDAPSAHEETEHHFVADPVPNYVTDEDESVALALGATGAEHEMGALLPSQSEEALDSAFEQTAIAPDSLGYIPMQAKLGAAIYQPAMSVKFGKLPNKVDLRPLMAPVEEHPAAGSGVAQAVASAYEYWIRKASKQDRPISRTFVYYNARWRAEATESNEGAAIQFALEGLMRFGACAETVWPGEESLLFARPGGDAYRDAAAFKIHDMAHVPLRIDAWKQALAEGKPIMFGCATFEGFEDCASQGGVVVLPPVESVAAETPRLRPLCAVGYSESERVFIVRASEGAAFGDNGYCYMPFDYLMSDVLNDGDCWVFIPKVPSQPPREVWSDDAAPVTNGGAGVDFAVEAHLPAEYQSIGRDLFESERRPYRTDVPEDFAHYVALAGRGAWDEMEQNDAGLLLAASTLEGGMAALASAFPGAAGRATGDFAAGDAPDAFLARRQKA